MDTKTGTLQTYPDEKKLEKTMRFDSSTQVPLHVLSWKSLAASFKSWLLGFAWPWLCTKPRAKAPLALIHNLYSKNILSHTLTPTHTHTMAGDSCSGDHDTAACGILWADMLTPVYSIYRTDRKALTHTHTHTNTHRRLGDEDRLQATGGLWCLAERVGSVWHIKVKSFMCVKPSEESYSDTLGWKEQLTHRRLSLSPVCSCVVSEIHPNMLRGRVS